MEEQVGSTTTVIKYYTFNGMTIAMKRGSILRYLHSDHLGSNSVVTNADGTFHSGQSYCAYGGQRIATWYGFECDPTAVNPLPTDRTFTGQEQDGTGLLYFQARFMDPALSMFVSPDTVVSNLGTVIDYNRFAYARTNPLKYLDEDGHSADCSIVMGIPGGLGFVAALLCQAGEAAIAYGPTLVQQAALWADKVPAVVDMLFNNPNGSQQAQQASSSAGNTAGPGGLDPNRLPHGFSGQEEFSRFGTQLQNGLHQAGYDDVQAAFQGSSVTGQKYTTGEMFGSVPQFP